MTGRNALYCQSGGVTAVINATACGVIESARAHADRMGTVFAARSGILGALREDLIDTASMSDAEVADLRITPGGVFGSCRYKLKSLDTQRREYERLIEVLAAHEIGVLFYNGGNDSADTALKVSQLGEHMGYPVRCIGVPKTIDNDLPVTDNCPGFGSVAKYVAVSILEAGFDVAAMAETSTKVFVMEVMGRHAGWIAAAAGVASRGAHTPPHLILFPEVPFDEDRFLDAVRKTVEDHEYCTIVVSEGVRGSDGKFLSEGGTRDAFGHAQLGGVAPLIAHLVTERLGYKHHWAVLDYLQRSARHLASQTDLDQAYAVGRAAVTLALEGRNAVMPVIKRLSDAPYRWEIVAADLDGIANVEKKMPEHYIREDGYGITEDCRAYVAPLIQGEAYPPYSNGLPDYRRFEFASVPRKLPAFEP